jgi:hypothetical protein
MLRNSWARPIEITVEDALGHTPYTNQIWTKPAP